MDRWETRPTRRSGGGRGRDPRRPALAAPERLEPRELLAYSPLGTSLPDLTVTGYSAPVASWGGPLTVTVDVHNIGASTFIEPLSLQPGSTSSADAGPAVVAVYAVHGPHTDRGAVPLGEITVPEVTQNSITQVTQTLLLPPRPARFPAVGTIDLVFVVNATDTVLEPTPNNASPPVPVVFETAVPDVVVAGFNAPPTLQPGDTIDPIITLENLGTLNSDVVGPLTVAIVASTTPFVNSGSTIVARYTVANVPALSQARPAPPLFGDTDSFPQSNFVAIVGTPVTLPVAPATYYIGVVISPYTATATVPQANNQAHARGFHSHGRHGPIARGQTVIPLEQLRQVGPATSGLPPAGVVSTPATPLPQFPFPVTGQLIGSAADGAFPPPFPVIPSNVSGGTSGNPVTSPIVIGPPGGFGGTGVDTPVSVSGSGGFTTTITVGTTGTSTTTTTTGGGGTTTGGGGGG